MTKNMRIFLLQIELRCLSGILLVIALVLGLSWLGMPVLAAGTVLGNVIRGTSFNTFFVSTTIAVNLVVSVLLWRAAHNPLKTLLLIDSVISVLAMAALRVAISLAFTQVPRGDLPQLIIGFLISGINCIALLGLRHHAQSNAVFEDKSA